MTSSEIRKSFLDFFREKGHTIVPSASLLPASSNLLFTNAGMNQFVPYFLGAERPPFNPPRAADTQKCIRAGGKHNDLDDVGLDTYHHTFFEMLGNWSFGDYFKAEAIFWAWELLTERWKFPPHRLYATVYQPGPGDPGEFDQEAWDHWAACFRAEGLDPGRHIVNGTKKDNFWMMGETGPCGPCSEVHVDLTPAADSGGSLVNAGDPRCIEIWNLVFIQFNSNADGSFSPLPARHVDTGMGFERIAGIIQCTNGFADFSRPISNYDTDIFRPIFQQIQELSGHYYAGTLPAPGTQGATEQEKVDIAFRVIADHIRTLAFAIADGILPGNTDRDYVVRRILRRAVRFGRVLGFAAAHREALLPSLVDPVIAAFSPVFGELERNRQKIHDILESEERNFNHTLDKGLELFQAELKRLGPLEKAFPPDAAFKLYDTYGFPVDLTELMAREAGLSVDLAAVSSLMERQRQRARTAQRKDIVAAERNLANVETVFVGFEKDESETNIVATLARGEDHFVAVDRSPFYAEMGGQIGDTGVLLVEEEKVPVTDTIRLGPTFYLKLGQPLDPEKAKATTAFASIDQPRRRAIEAHHTATHLLHGELHTLLGPGVSQRGSYVGPDRLRFDFNSAALSRKQIETLEREINRKIIANAPVSWIEVPYTAVSGRADIMQFFGEKYGDKVRVVQIGGAPGALDGYSMELCGGTHVRATGQIGAFNIMSEGAISAGVRRIEAVCGLAAIEHLKRLLAAQTQRALDLEAKLADVNKHLEREQSAALHRQASALAATLLRQINPSETPRRLIKSLGVAGPELLQAVVDELKKRHFSGVAVLAGTSEERVNLAISVEPEFAEKIHAGKMMQQIAPIVGGKGGGKAESARGAGKDLERINDALRLAGTLF